MELLRGLDERMLVKHLLPCCEPKTASTSMFVFVIVAITIRLKLDSSRIATERRFPSSPLSTLPVIQIKYT